MRLLTQDLVAQGSQLTAPVRPVRSPRLVAEAAKRSTHVKRKVAKRRDIRTSFRAPVGPGGLQVPPTLAITSPALAAQPQLQQPLQPQLVSIPLIKPPLPPPDTSSTAATASWPAAPVAIPLRQPCSTSSSTTSSSGSARGRSGVSDAVVALTAIQAPVQSSVDEETLSLPGGIAPGRLAGLTWDAAATSSSDSSLDDAGAESFDPLASLDRVLDGLLIAPTTTAAAAAAQPGADSPPANRTSSRSSGNSSSTIDLRKLAAQASANAAAAAAAAAGGASPAAPKAKAKAGASRRSSSKGSAAAAAPAVAPIHSEADWQRELEAAAAAGQLLVVKVESGRPLLRGAADPSLRFQTHTNLPTSLNTYLPHPELHVSRGYSPLGSYQPRSTAFSAISSLNGSPGSSASSIDGGCSIDGSCSGSPELASPLHSWYQQLAASYAAGSGSKLRFLSLQCDAARAKVLCRRLGVSAGLSVLLFDPAGGGRKVLELCGTKIEQELPSGLLYHADMDPAGRRPSELLPTISSRAELDTVRSSSGLAVVACHMRGAPPCIKTFGALYSAAQAHSPAVPFAVLDADHSDDCAAAAAELELARLPTYLVYRDGAEVARLSSTSERRGLQQLLDELAAPKLA